MNEYIRTIKAEGLRLHLICLDPRWADKTSKQAADGMQPHHSIRSAKGHDWVEPVRSR